MNLKFRIQRIKQEIEFRIQWIKNEIVFQKSCKAFGLVVSLAMITLIESEVVKVESEIVKLDKMI